MKLTTNYSLKKPEGSDVVNIEDFNYNSDILDNKLKSVDADLSSLKNKVNTVEAMTVISSSKPSNKIKDRVWIQLI